MALSNEEAIVRWVLDNANGGMTSRTYSSGAIRPNEEGQLTYGRRERWNRRPWGPVILATWASAHRTFVLNGDGFTDRNATHWQNQLRAIVQAGVLEHTRPDPNRWVRHHLPERTHYVLVPYAAMRAAGIDLLSIRPVDVTQDEWENIEHQVGEPPEPEQFTTRQPSSDQYARTLECTHRGRRWRTSERRVNFHEHSVSKERSTHVPLDARHEWVLKHEWKPTNQYHVYEAGEHEPAGWHPVTPVGGRETHYFWLERRHHLGAAVFTASDGNGRKRFLSAFDEDEPRQMYFLAQLPPRAKANTYREAVNALAPPIIHQARANAIEVFRQGDVFAVATEKEDEWVYGNRLTRVRREVALHDPTRQGITPPQMDAIDYGERSACPCCGHTMKVGWGPRSRRALMIYGTSHTATEVVVVKGGAVYMRGTMHHDPQLEDPRRRPEHVEVALGDRKTWYLAVRNTVPRRKNNNNGEEGTA